MKLITRGKLMRKNEKNRAKDNIWLKQAGFFALVLAWILAIYFKNDLSKTMMIIVFILLVIATFFVIFWLNRVFFGLTNQPKEDKKDLESSQDKEK
ncbi:Putative uncharacterized protein [Lactococcus lactis subsp. lactis A12]|uniref:Uncharacterized protein n=5 Tax=Lactococcus lactis TaxID=1358 RepID=S6FAU1_LACLL|nr:Putative uncharacterized protein [Lactococcus lactis subsp. lactis A12]